MSRSAVRAPVPMSAAAIRIVYPSLVSRAVAVDGRRRPGRWTRPRRCRPASGRGGGRLAAGRARPSRTAPRPAQAGDQVPRAERQAAVGLGSGVVDDPQLHRVHAERDRQLVHRRLECVHPRRLARRAHPGRRGHVQPGQPVRGPHGRRAVHDAGAGRGLLGELGAHGGVLGHVVRDRPQPTVGVGGELDALDGRRPVTGEGEHLLPGERHLDRAAGRAGGDGGQDGVRPGGALGPEAAAHVRRDDPHLPGRQAEHVGDGVPVGRRPLGGVVHGQHAGPCRRPCSPAPCSGAIPQEAIAACGSIGLLCCTGVV